MGILTWSLRNRWAIVLLSVMVFASTFVVNKYIGRDWMPQEDQAELGLWIELPEGSSLALTEKVALEISGRLEREVPGVATVVPMVQSSFLERVNMSFMTILLKPTEERTPIDDMGARHGRD